MDLPIVYPDSNTNVPSPSALTDRNGFTWEAADRLTLFSDTPRSAGPATGRVYRGGLLWASELNSGGPGHLFYDGWVGFVNFGAMAPSDSPERLPSIVDALWSGMSNLRPVQTESYGFGAMVAYAIEHSAFPNRIVVDGTGWRRDASCAWNCDPNIENLTTYWSGPDTLVNIGANPDDHILSYNQARIDAVDGDSSGLVVENVLDALELMCEAAHSVHEGAAGGCDTAHVPDVSTRADMPRLRQFLECSANEIEAQGERVVLQNLPRQLVEGWTSPVGPGQASSDTGDLGSATHDIQQALTELSGVHRAIASEIRAVNRLIEALELALATLDAQREIADLHTLSAALTQVAGCASSGSVQSAVVTCANAVEKNRIE